MGKHSKGGTAVYALQDGGYEKSVGGGGLRGENVMFGTGRNAGNGE
jgi:hypothetical protein